MMIFAIIMRFFSAGEGMQWNPCRKMKTNSDLSPAGRQETFEVPP